MNGHPALARNLTAAVLLSLLAACTQTPEVKPRPPEHTPQQAAQIRQADRLAASGDFTAAAATYGALANSVKPPLQDQLWVQAADAWVQAGEMGQAATALGRANRDRLGREMHMLARLAEAEILLAGGRPEPALATLGEPMPGIAAGGLSLRWINARARALSATGNALEAARSLSQLDQLLTDETLRLENQVRLIDTLSNLTDSSLQTLRPSPPGIFGGWMDLARSLRSDQPELAIDTWRTTHPGHPALPQLLARYMDAAEADLLAYGRIAVLLPASGRYAKAGQALRSGLMAAYYAAAPEHRPPLSFYDTSNSADVWPLYQQAVADGAGAVIGPLQKSSVEQLARAGELAIPVLALNRVNLDIPPPAGFYQFGLSPEDEASQAAEKAWREGVVTALALVPDSDWGMRLLNSFRERFESLGGRLAEHQSYDPTQHDFSEPIEALLNLDDSQTRYKALTKTLGRRFEFEPAPRGDAGVLFLAANAAKARQIWPQLQFNRVSGIPVYSTSDIYTGHFSVPRDLDLIGLNFSDIPWLLDPGERAPFTPDNAPAGIPTQGALGRLFAMGMDSYRLLAGLKRLEAFPGASLPGATGDLSLDELNRVHRELLWARMEREGPRIHGRTATPQAEDATLDDREPASTDAASQ